MSKLTPSERNQIISDYKHGIPNEEYRVLETSSGKFQVRKRKSPFKSGKEEKHVEIIPEKEEPKEEPKKVDDRMSNEDLLRKLSTLLDVPQQKTEQTPEEHEAEEEAYEQEQEYYNSRADLGFNPYIRRPLRLF
jgi:hypothetical protein